MATAEKTEIGSCFISNYPPFSVWQSRYLPDALGVLDAPPSPRTPLGLYMHIPFCRKRCKFCYYRVYTDKNSSDVEVYLDAMAREAALYADRAGIGGRDFEFVYFGGGTPSFLSNAQLQRLVESISRHWTWEAAREVTFECEPGTLKKSKLETIKAIGVTRLSLGVEHFDDDVLTRNGRAHKSPEIFRAYEWARQIGFDQINIDLIAGMVGETEAKWHDTIEKALGLDPDSVTIYQMELPYNTEFSKESLRLATDPPVADWPTKRRWVGQAFAAFERAGYVVSSGYTLVNPARGGRFVYRDSVWRGADMIGMGVASFSHFNGVHYQNVDRWEEYVGRLGEGNLAIGRALPVTRDQRLIRELILQLKLGKIEAGYFRDKFDQEITDRFAEPFASLVKDGYSVIDGDEVRLTREGLLRVDELLPRFFDPEFRSIRYT